MNDYLLWTGLPAEDCVPVGEVSEPSDDVMVAGEDLLYDPQRVLGTKWGRLLTLLTLYCFYWIITPTVKFTKMDIITNRLLHPFAAHLSQG